MARVEDSIRPILEEALKAGFHVYVLKEERRPVGFAYVALDPNGSFAAVNVATHNWEDPTLGAEIRPSREYGSSVLVDYDGTPAGAVEALKTVCESPTVRVRFMKTYPAPVVPNYGRNVLDKWPGGPERFEELTLETLETAQ